MACNVGNVRNARDRNGASLKAVAPFPITVSTLFPNKSRHTFSTSRRFYATKAIERAHDDYQKCLLRDAAGCQQKQLTLESLHDI